jgi:hypothetical protein
MERLKRYLLATTGLIIMTTAFALTTTGRALAQTSKQLWYVVFTDASGNPVGNTVKVSNLPASQPISGTVGVNNFPAVQPISGTVSIGNNPTVNAQQSGPWTVNFGSGAEKLDAINTNLTNLTNLLAGNNASVPVANAMTYFDINIPGFTSGQLTSLQFAGKVGMNVSYIRLLNPNHATMYVYLFAPGQSISGVPVLNTNQNETNDSTSVTFTQRVPATGFQVECSNVSDPCNAQITFIGDQTGF